jgi:hypothetical protein
MVPATAAAVTAMGGTVTVTVAAAMSKLALASHLPPEVFIFSSTAPLSFCFSRSVRNKSCSNPDLLVGPSQIQSGILELK